MRKINPALICGTVKRLCGRAAHILPSDILKAISYSSAKEKKTSAKKNLNLCLENAKIAKKDLIPLCQDTGTAVLFVEIGAGVYVDGNLEEALQGGVREGYKEHYLRKSIVSDPLFERKNTGDNTPAVIHYSFAPGDKLKIKLLLKGGGAENKSRVKMFAPSSEIKEIENFIVGAVEAAGSMACPPFVVGVGLGGNFELCARLAKKALGRKAGQHNRNKKYAALEKALLAKINKLNMGPQGLGGLTTALAVNIEFAPCHMASLPVAVNIGCHSSRHAEAVL